MYVLMPMQIPSIFISSTFYDLRQVRTDLYHFIQDELGYGALASEFPSFPIDPDANTVANCRRRVQDDADILVLIIGGRYGTIPADASKSVTNLEYLIAGIKGIPIYTFVERDVLAVLPTWQSNPSADFSRTVDTPELFKFVSQVRSADSRWVFTFETAQDITDTLRIQFAFLMAKGLHLGQALKGRQKELDGITGESLRIALEKPAGWQGKLFAQLFTDEVVNARDLKRRYELGLVYGPSELLADDAILGWLQAKLTEAERLAEGVTHLANHALNQAFTNSDVQEIAFCAREMGRSYRNAIEWAIHIRRAHVGDDWLQLANEMALVTGDIIRQIELLGSRLTVAIDDAIATAKKDQITVDFTFVIEAENIQRVYEEIERLKGRLA